ncbi:hypothetical protein CDAR_45051 [Caerostris darwini]|uniref:Uncharacterized protein n=1 Tax=Caerostris darwini TaxID=1538125 RepID=A0AAV4UXV7_9ARAC|nr:hypothetical protein CDAR_45051 [Caerostris darwini]
MSVHQYHFEYRLNTSSDCCSKFRVGMKQLLLISESCNVNIGSIYSSASPFRELQFIWGENKFPAVIPLMCLCSAEPVEDLLEAANFVQGCPQRSSPGGSVSIQEALMNLKSKTIKRFWASARIASFLAKAEMYDEAHALNLPSLPLPGDGMKRLEKQISGGNGGRMKKRGGGGRNGSLWIT